MPEHALVRHPETPCTAVAAVTVAVAPRNGGGLVLCYRLEGDLDGLRVPVARPPRRVDGLWRHTCFEAFVMGDDAPAYREFNFAPSGEWAAFAFRAYRDGGAWEPPSAPTIGSGTEAGVLRVEAGLAAAVLPQGPLRLALSAVIEDADGDLSYWALRHPAGRPDFHHPEGYAVQFAVS